MVGFNGMDHGRGLLILPCQFNTQLDMAAFHFVVHGLAQVVEQTGALGQGHIHTQLAGKQAGDMSNFHRMVQNVLTIRGAVLLAAKELDQLRMQTVDTGLEGGAFAFHLDGMIHFSAGFFHHIFDTGGMDTAIGDQLFQRQSCHFAADRIEGRDSDGFGSIINDQIHAGDGFKGADVAAFTADDAALHFIVGQRNNRNGSFCGVIGGAALNGGGDDLASKGIGLLLHLSFDLLDLHGAFVAHFCLQFLQQEVLCIFFAQTGDLFQHFQLAALDGVDLFLGGGHSCQLLGKVFFFLFVGFDLLIEGFFSLLETALLLLQVAAAFLQLLLIFGTRFMNLFLGFQQHFTLLAFSGLDGFIEDALGFLFRGTDLFFRDFFAVCHTDQEENNTTYHKRACDQADCKYHIHHNVRTHLLVEIWDAFERKGRLTFP